MDFQVLKSSKIGDSINATILVTGVEVKGSKDLQLLELEVCEFNNCPDVAKFKNTVAANSNGKNGTQFKIALGNALDNFMPFFSEKIELFESILNKNNLGKCNIRNSQKYKEILTHEIQIRTEGEGESEVCDNMLKKCYLILDAAKESLKSHFEVLSNANKKTDGKHLNVVISDFSPEDMKADWRIVDIDGKKMNKNDDIYAGWHLEVRKELDLFLQSLCVEVSEDQVEALKVIHDLKTRISDNIIKVSEFIQGQGDISEISHKINGGNGLGIDLHRISPLSTKFEMAGEFFSKLRDRIDRKFDQLADILPSITEQSLVALNHIMVKDFIDLGVKELALLMLKPNKDNLNISNPNYISFNTLRKLDPSIAARVLKASEAFVSKGISGSRYLPEEHTVLKQLKVKKNNGHTHLIVGISSKERNWDFGPFLKFFCESVERKKTQVNIMVDPEIPGIKVPKVCSVPLELTWKEARQFKELNL